LWKWNPFRPALSWEKAEQAAALTMELQKLQRKLMLSPQAEVLDGLRENTISCRKRLDSIFKKKCLRKAPGYAQLDAAESLQKEVELLERTLLYLRTERELS
jgi:hypothetical protein